MSDNPVALTTSAAPHRGQDTEDIAAGQFAGLMQAVDAHCPFGPAFFLGQLGGLVRDRCPRPEDGLPTVRIRLGDGEHLNLCHVIGFAPLWVALAVWESDGKAMRTELVPYEAIVRVTISPAGIRSNSIGFEQTRAPAVLAGRAMSPEQALRAAEARSEDS